MAKLPPENIYRASLETNMFLHELPDAKDLFMVISEEKGISPSSVRFLALSNSTALKYRSPLIR